MNNISINPKTDALIIIDVQNDFCPGGALAVQEGDQIIQGIVELAERFDTVVLTQDWHMAGHASFASTHDAEPFSSTKLYYGNQKLWPDHCIQGSKGAEFHDDLLTSNVMNKTSAIIRKGTNIGIDSYSAFFENDQTTPTGLSGFLKDRNIERVVLVGLAYDFCVAYSALDARKEGFEAVIVKDFCRSINMPVEDTDTNTVDLMEEKFANNNVEVINLVSATPNFKI